jgi:hypothetical protein
MIEALDELHVALQEVVSVASGVPLSRVILADQGRGPPEPPNSLYATYNPVPVRAYGQPRKDRTLVEGERTALQVDDTSVLAVDDSGTLLGLATGPSTDHQDLEEITVTQLELMLSVNFLNEGARDAAMKMQNANFRYPVSVLLNTNQIGWRNASEIRRLTQLTQGGLQPRYQTDLDLFVEMGITDNILRAAGFSFTVEDESGNTVATGG